MAPFQKMFIGWLKKSKLTHKQAARTLAISEGTLFSYLAGSSAPPFPKLTFMADRMGEDPKRMLEAMLRDRAARSRQKLEAT